MRDHSFSVSQGHVRNVPLLLTLVSTVALLLLGTTSGCRTARDNQIDLLERELRAQEDYIYQLEDYVAQYSQKLRETRMSSSKTVILKQDSLPAPARPTRSDPNGRPPAPPRLPQEERERRLEREERLELPDRVEEIPDPAPFRPEELEAPDLELEIGEPIGEFESDVPATRLASTLIGSVEHVNNRDDGYFSADHHDAPPSSLALNEPAGLVTDSSVLDDSSFDDGGAPHLGNAATGAPTTPEFDEFDEHLAHAQPLPGRQAQKVMITQLFRGGEEGDTQLSSFLSVVQARDASNQPADIDGAVSLMIMTADESNPQRIKRWDFTAEETAASWQASHLGEGLHLELPLANVSLPDEPIEIWVRLVTSDGRKLLAELPFDAADLATLDSISEMESSNALRLATAEQMADTLDEGDGNPLRTDVKTEKGTPIHTASADSTKVEQPRWRAAAQHSDASTAPSPAKGNGWTAQSFSRSENRPTSVATREQPDAEPPRIRIPASVEWKSRPIR